MNRRAAPLLLTVVAALAAPAAALGRPATLHLSGLRGVPQRVAPGQAFTVTAGVSVRRARARRVTATATLRRGGTVGRRVVKRLKPGVRRSLRLRVQVPRRGVSAGRNRLRVCAHARRFKRLRCVTRAITITRPGRPSPTSPAPSPAVPSQPSQTPAPSATAGPNATPTPATSPSAGSETIGDVLFPNLGNGGYDVQGLRPRALLPAPHRRVGRLRDHDGDGHAGAVAPQLDLQGFTVSSVEVDGQPAGFERFDGGTDPLAAHKLRVTPAEPIPAGATFTVVGDLQRRSARDRRPGRVQGGLRRHHGRRLGRRRADGQHGLVPQQQPSERQGDVPSGDDRAVPARPLSATGCSSLTQRTRRPRGP